MTDYSPLQPTRDTDQHEQQKLAKKIKNFIYDPSQVIGSGFSSKVYKGINQLNNQQVAIKVIELSKIQNEVEKYLLNNQINALRALNHKNILKTIDILMTKNNVYIVTQFCQFGDLQQMIRNNKKLQQKDALNIAKDIVEGYLTIQQKNIIHRDLKTANIFLSKSGAKIADFGFCEFVGQRKPQIAYNVGSPAYMSPESYKQNFYSHKSDIWGIGIILYEMLIGETPQKNLTYTQMSNNLMNSKINCGTNQQIRQILISCFKKDIKQRIDAKDLLQKITSLLEKMNFSRQQGRASNLPHPDSRFSKNNSQVSIPESHFLQGTGERNNIKFPVEQNKFRSFSPSKMNPLISKGQFEQSNKQVSMFNNQNNDQGSRTIANKKDILHNSGLIQTFNTSKVGQLSDQPKRIRASIAVLQFIFRLFKYLSQVSIPTLSFLKLFTFRHRSYIDQITQSIFQQNKYQIKKDSQLYKQFQFLKIKFDQAYLDRENNSNIQGNHQLMNTMNKLANLNFIDPQSIKAYKEIIKKGCLEIQFQITENRSNSFVLWDYLMLEYELLSLYGQGFSDQTIVNEKIPLQAILKQQPKNLTKAHIQLLKMKSKYLFESLNSDQNEMFTPSTSNYPSGSLFKATY